MFKYSKTDYSTFGELHPDGQPWQKCCGNKNDCMCAYRKYTSLQRPIIEHLNLSEGKNRMEMTKYDIENCKGNDKVFPCIHRKTDDGYLRVCAGFGAKRKMGKI